MHDTRWGNLWVVVGVFLVTGGPFSRPSVAADELEIVSVTPPSPSALGYEERVVVTCRYTLESSESAHIWVRPFTGGANTPGSAAHPSPSYPRGAGEMEGWFTFSDDADVDEIRAEMRGPDNALLSEAVWRVEMSWRAPIQSQCTIMNVKFAPASPAKLSFGEHVEITYDYVAEEVGGIRIQSLPFAGGKMNQSYGCNPSPVYNGRGTGTAFFTVRDSGGRGSVAVGIDEFRLIVTSEDWKTKIAEIPFAVDFVFAEEDSAGDESPVLPSQGAPRIGEAFPRLEFQATDGRPVSTSDLLGRVVLVDFWATWCGPCRKEIPTLVSVYREHRDEGFEILGISLDKDRTALEKYTRDQEMSWPQYYDGQGWENAISTRFGITGIPASYLIDRGGKLRYADLRGAQLAAAVRNLIAEQR